MNGILDLYNKEKETNKLLLELSKQDNDILKKQGAILKIYNIDYISKDKIKEKIKELKDLPENQYIHLDYTKEILEELLKENNKCK